MSPNGTGVPDDPLLPSVEGRTSGERVRLSTLDRMDRVRLRLNNTISGAPGTLTGDVTKIQQFNASFTINTANGLQYKVIHDGRAFKVEALDEDGPAGFGTIGTLAGVEVLDRANRASAGTPLELPGGFTTETLSAGDHIGYEIQGHDARTATVQSVTRENVQLGNGDQFRYTSNVWIVLEIEDQNHNNSLGRLTDIHLLDGASTGPAVGTGRQSREDNRDTEQQIRDRIRSTLLSTVSPEMDGIDLDMAVKGRERVAEMHGVSTVSGWEDTAYESVTLGADGQERLSMELGDHRLHIREQARAAEQAGFDLRAAGLYWAVGAVGALLRRIRETPPGQEIGLSRIDLVNIAVGTETDVDELEGILATNSSLAGVFEGEFADLHATEDGIPDAVDGL